MMRPKGSCKYLAFINYYTAILLDTIHDSK